MGIQPVSSSPLPFGGAASLSGAKRSASSDEVEAEGWRQLSLLTPADRAAIKAATGKDVPTKASGQPPVAPILAFTIAGDRQSGFIPTGKPLDAAYFKTLAAQYASQGKADPFGPGVLDRAIKFLLDHPPASQFDTHA